MSVARSPFPKDQLLCSICQHVFTDPVSTPCGHNFCKNCISEHWDINVPCKCPNCKKRFKRRPVLQVNSLISEIVSRIKESAQQRASSSSEQQAANPREVPCDICTGTKLKALKSCLVCLVSYCETHLQPHLTLSLSEDHLRLLQNLQSLKAAPPTKDWTEVRVRSPSYEGNMRSASAPLVEMLIIELKKLLPKTELRTAQQSAVDVTLDPDTAHCQLLLSGDGEQVCHPKYGDFEKKLPDNPKRFSTGLCVVGKQVISTGRFYFEVQVKGKTQWVIGVAKESINRKGLLYIDPQNGYWTLGLRKENKYYAPACRLNSKSQPEKVGVFVDYEEGLVLFYDVDAANLIHAFTGCSFTERLLPFFCPSSNQLFCIFLCKLNFHDFMTIM
uniref:Uncharacterized protein n=1 Tax=Sparus aurata TaxID=8175 RepID=A0A671W2U5_SPAAU